MTIDAVKSTAFQGSDSGVSIKKVGEKSTVDSKVTVKTTDAKLQSNTEKSVIKADDDVVGAVMPKEIKAKELKRSVEEINSKLNRNTECVFGMHEETNRVIIKIIDKETKEVVKEIPPEKTLEMITKIWEFAGLLVDQKL